MRSEGKFKKFKAEKEELGLSVAAKTAKKSRGRRLWQARKRPFHLVSSWTWKGLSINWPNTIRKCLQIPSEHSGPFSASTGFQWRFCRRIGLLNIKICGKKLGADSSAANIFINEFSVITEGYSEHQVINCDETELYLRMLPWYTLTSVHVRPDRILI